MRRIIKKSTDISGFEIKKLPPGKAKAFQNLKSFRDVKNGHNHKFSALGAAWNDDSKIEKYVRSALVGYKKGK